MACVGGQAVVRGASEEAQHRLPTDCCPGGARLTTPVTILPETVPPLPAGGDSTHGPRTTCGPICS